MCKIITLIIFLYSFTVVGQGNYELILRTDDYKKVKKNIEQKFSDSTSAKKYLNDLYLLALRKGYLTASIDTITIKNQTIRASFFLGELFSSVSLIPSKEDKIFIKKNSRINEKTIASIPFNPAEISRLMKQIHFSALNNGYPFAKIFLEKFEFNESKLRANLVVERGQLMKIDAIHIKGDSSVSSVFICNLIDIQLGQLYNESKLNDISSKIGQISFVKEVKAHELLFTEKGVELFLYLKASAVSSINGTIGLQPNPITNRVSFTGELDLKLQNVLKRGENIQLNWRSIQAQTQSLNAKANLPFILKTPIGVNGQFQLYKRDTTFLEVKSLIGAQYFLRGGNYLTVFYQRTNSDLLSGSTSNPSFSNLAKATTNAYGISLFKRKMDYIPNPSKGMNVSIELSVGNRKSQVKDTSTIVTATTYRGAFRLDWFISIASRQVLRVSNHAEIYYAPKIYQNEVFRFGGLLSFRGFNEEEIYATTRNVFTLEYRYLLDRNSHVFAFYDQAIYENNATKYIRDTPFGVGAGFSFGTKLGIFSIAYAIGKQFNNPILLSNGKIHFGYIAYF